MDKTLYIAGSALALGLLGILAVVRRAKRDSLTEIEVTSERLPLSDVLEMQNTTGKVWQAPEKYRFAIQAAEGQHSIPPRLLERLLWQESRYREDIISGEVASSAGALGIAQIVPRWHPDVDPLNPNAAIPYAANYLSSLHTQFGSWEKALAAYNWGPGNLSRVAAAPSWLQRTPTETQNYVREIIADVPA